MMMRASMLAGQQQILGHSSLLLHTYVRARVSDEPRHLSWRWGWERCLGVCESQRKEWKEEGKLRLM